MTTSGEEDKLVQNARTMEFQQLDLNSNVTFPSTKYNFPQELNVKITKKPIIVCDPSAIGVCSLAMVCLMVCMSSFGATSTPVVLQAPWIIVLSGFLMLIAGIVDAFRRNIFGAVVFVMYATFWLALGCAQFATHFGSEDDVEGGAQHSGAAVFGYIIFNFSCILISLSLNKILFYIMVAIEFVLVFLTLELLEGTPSWPTGLFLLITSLLSFYYCFANLINHLAGGDLICVGKPIFLWSSLVQKK
ncbi:inner membrane protein yaah [Anaeramoeba flamelloides]|uniref:Inner membrane protein yaah n=1 Tax=Anaeramoeba flamelloides TaxID=1746091 RepID=A0ABQ8YUP0_9EUKA|nr:inner membrane protein yaah [Anaeramoeba flamelloides]